MNNSNAEVVKILIEKGASVNALDGNKQTPLHKAAYNNSNAEVVKILIEKGASVNALDYGLNKILSIKQHIITVMLRL